MSSFFRSDVDIILQLQTMATSGGKEVQMFAEQYFKTQNFLNKKILDDISSIRNKFQKPAWEKMSVTEKDQVINNHLQKTRKKILNYRTAPGMPSTNSF